MRALRVTRRRLASVLGIVCVVVVLVSCRPTVSPLDPSLRAGILTPDGADVYGLTVANGVVRAAAPANNASGNTRVGFWRSAELASVNQQTCATWVDARSELYQQGAALRVRTANGRTTAITVTNNIFFHARWIFNVHVMDSAANPRFRQIASFDLSSVFNPGGSGNVPPYPWRMCARVMGDTVSFIVWPLTHAQPSWNDARYGGSVRLPAGWGSAGSPGFYVGHLEPGDSVGYRDLATALIASGPNQAEAQARSTTATVAPEPTTSPREPTWIPRAP